MRERIWVFISPQERQISTDEGGGGLAAILMQDVTCAVNLLPNELVHVCVCAWQREKRRHRCVFFATVKMSQWLDRSVWVCVCTHHAWASMMLQSTSGWRLCQCLCSLFYPQTEFWCHYSYSSCIFSVMVGTFHWLLYWGNDVFRSLPLI